MAKRGKSAKQRAEEKAAAELEAKNLELATDEEADMAAEEGADQLTNEEQEAETIMAEVIDVDALVENDPPVDEQGASVPDAVELNLPVPEPESPVDPAIAALQAQMGQLMEMMGTVLNTQGQQPPELAAGVSIKPEEPVLVHAESQRMFGILIDAILPPNGAFEILEDQCSENELLERGADIEWLLSAGIIEDRGVQLTHVS